MSSHGGLINFGAPGATFKESEINPRKLMKY